MKTLKDPYKGIPAAVRIGCFHFKVEVTEFEDAEANGSFGHMNPISQKIRLRPGMTAQNLANTFIHEVLHGIYWFMCSGTFSITKDQSLRRIEEEYVTKGANGLCEFIQNNPEAAAWWLSCVSTPR